MASVVSVHVTVGHGLVCLSSAGCSSLWMVSVLDGFVIGACCCVCLLFDLFAVNGLC